MNFHDLLKRIGAKIRMLREAKGWSLEKLAHEIGSEKGYMSNIELGKANVTIETLCKIAEQLGVEVKEFFV